MEHQNGSAWFVTQCGRPKHLRPTPATTMTSFSSSANPNDAHSTKIQVGSQQHNIRQSLRNCAPLSHSPAQEWHDVLLQLMMSSSEAHSPPTLYTTPTVARWKTLFWNLIEPEWFPCTLFLANFCMVASHFLATPGWTLPRLDRRPQWAQSPPVHDNGTPTDRAQAQQGKSPANAQSSSIQIQNCGCWMSFSSCLHKREPKRLQARNAQPCTTRRYNILVSAPDKCANSWIGCGAMRSGCGSFRSHGWLCTN